MEFTLRPKLDAHCEYSVDYDDALTLTVPLAQQQRWFKDITGLEEEEFRDNIESCMEVKHNAPGFLEITNQKTGKRTQAGKFSVTPLSTLFNFLDDPRIFKFNAPYPVFEIITRIDSESVKYVDVGYLQALPENAGSLFQVASNFNGVEAATELYSPTCHNFVTKYIFDRTQGPIASISCGASAISRNYGAFADSKTATSEWSQTDDKQVNFLENLKEHFPVYNGYVIMSGNEPKFVKKNWKKYMASASVGIHEGCEVTTGFGFAPVTKPQKVDQCFTAALNMAQGSSGLKNKACPDGELKSQFILDVAYHGTYMTAIQKQHKQLFLTMIGGGAFGNSKHNIYESILLAHQKWARHEHGRLEVVKLIIYNVWDLSKSFLQQLRSNNIPYKCIVYWKGKPHVVENFSVT